MTNAGSEPAVSWWRWVGAVLAGFLSWVAFDWLLWLLLGATEYALVGNLISIAFAILVVGLLVGARSVRRWLTVMLVAALVVAVLGAILFALAFSVGS